MKNTKKILSVFLALLMLFSSAPLSTNISDLFALEASAAEIVDSGSFGSLQWSYDDEGTLTISGEGKMVAQQYFEIPWFTKRAELKTVIIEDGVQNIGNFAFQNCTELTSVTVPTSVIAIEKSAFEGCSSFGTIYYAGAESQWNEIEISTELNEALTTATMNYALLAAGTYGENLTWTLNKEGTLTVSGEGDMNNYAYNAVPWSAYKAKIKTAVIESGVTSIGNNAFNGCTNLSSVTIPEGVETIGESAFDSCASLQTVTLPNSVKNIYVAAFIACTDLTNINLPDGLVSLGFQSFASCYSLTSITIPGTVKNIGQEAFFDCGNLKSVTILDGVETIGSSAFSNCFALTSVTIPTSVTYIEEYAFSGSNFIETVYYGGVESQWNEIEIGTDNDSLINATKSFAIIEGICGDNLYWVFDESTGTLTISGEGDMNNYAYDNVPWLAYKTDIKTAVIESGATSIGDYAFNGCTNLSSVTIPEGVENIGESAFRSCTSLQTVTLPDSIRNIYDSAFRNCTGFTDINLPDGLLTIGDSCFYACTGLTSIAIPGTVTKISFEAFYCCENLESVIIFDGVETIGEDAFAGCLALTSVTIPTSVTCIEEYAFSYSDAIEPVYYGGSESQWNKITIGSNNPVLSAATKVFAVVEGICGNNLTWSLNKNTGILTISGEGDMYSYFMDAPWMSYTDSINTVIVENGVTSISSFAFYNCANITSVTLPDTLEEICANSFYNCTGLTGITIPDSVSIIYSAAFAGSGITEIVIPDGIEEIAGSTFANCKNLTTVTIPDSVTGIGANAFNGCDALTSVYYGDSIFKWNEITIDSNNDTLLNVNIQCSVPSGKCGDSLFWIFDESTGTLTISGEGDMYDFDYDNNAQWQSYAKQINTVVIEEGVASIGKQAFYLCKNITDVTIAGSVNQIGGSAFMGCEKLKSITIPESVTYIGAGAFRRCSGLKSIVIPGSVTSIENYCFRGCASLESVTIPYSVTVIGDGAFIDCDAIETVYYGGSKEQWNEITIGSGCDALINATIVYAICNHTGGEATCSNKAVCEVCGNAYGEVNAENHKNKQVITGTPASCGKGGLTDGEKCNDCGNIITAQKEIPATGDHKNTEIRNAVEATYEVEGYTGDKYCKECDTLIEKGTSIPKLEKPTEPDTPDIPDEPNDNNCDHMCHSDSGFVQFFWKIIRFFQKLFKIEQYCDCGVQHW